MHRQAASGERDWRHDQEPEWHLAVRHYTDEGIRAAEVQALFRALPLVVAHSSELGMGQVLTHDGYDLPMLLSRDQKGQVHAHLNVCRHRGMRLLDGKAGAVDKTAVVCPYHAWSYQLDGALRHISHAEGFDACAPGQRDLVRLPCAERHGLIWVLPVRDATLDLAAYLGAMDTELPYFAMDQLTHFRTTEAIYDCNWKLLMDAFLESYHIRVLHQKSIYPFFMDGVVASERVGRHIHSLVARRECETWAKGSADIRDTDLQLPLTQLCQLSTPSHILFPNTIATFHPDYLSLISLFPVAAGKMRWQHRMLVPKHKISADWLPHWHKTHELIEKTVFQKEDIYCAVDMQKGFNSGANDYLTVGRMERGMQWFHEQVAAELEGLGNGQI
ncbi:MAG: hypothetical protein RLZZ502_1531 [Pseudomonadota bacterium]